MASVKDQHHPVYNVDNIYDDVDVDDDDDSASSPSLAGEVTIAVAGVSATDSPSFHPDPKRQRISEFTVPAATVEKKPSAIDDSRKLFQRLWTDEDEIELLRGFLEYTTQRGMNNPSQQHHYDTTAFYDQIKSKFQLDFNKNQLVEKLRRLKKKYRTVMSKINSGKEFVFKSPHDQATFEISRKIWCTGGSAVRGVSGNAGAIVCFSGPPEDGGLEDDDAHLTPNPNPGGTNNNFIDHSPVFNLNYNPNGIDVKTPTSRKRSPVGAEAVKVEIQHVPMPTTNQTQTAPTPVAAAAAATSAMANVASIPGLIEETVKSCVSPIFKELLNNVANLNGPRGGFGVGGMGLSPIPLGFGGGAMSMEMMRDEKWRKQQMLELEVYSKRLELVQDQIKAQLEELRSMGS